MGPKCSSGPKGRPPLAHGCHGHLASAAVLQMLAFRGPWGAAGWGKARLESRTTLARRQCHPADTRRDPVLFLSEGAVSVQDLLQPVAPGKASVKPLIYAAGEIPGCPLPGKAPSELASKSIDEATGVGILKDRRTARLAKGDGGRERSSSVPISYRNHGPAKSGRAKYLPPEGAVEYAGRRHSSEETK